MNQITAIIVKGNPKFIESNPAADSFYESIKLFLENLGYQVLFDKGEPYTSPKRADLWIGHSRGVDRLRFAPQGTATLMFGSFVKGSVTHPNDNSLIVKYPSDVPPNKFHYIFTDEMKRSILDITERIKNKA